MSDQKQIATTTLTSVNDRFFPMVTAQLTGNGIKMDDYAKQCVINAISAIHTALDAKGISWGDPQLDQSNVTQVLLSVACLKLNASATPREVYFQTRNVSVKVRGEGGKEETVWKKKIEMGIEGDGNDAILARFGRDVKKVGQFWPVREGDAFEYPRYVGLQMDPPKWTPTGKGDVVRVVYPILKKDDTIEFYIAERDDVARNLLAHINNNMMNETFGICAKRFDATPDQLKKIAEKKADILKKAKNLGLGALDDAELQQWISPAWTEYHSREAMLIRKMRNNIVKKMPKDFGNAFVEMTYSEQTDEGLAQVRGEIAEHANSQDIDIVGEAVPDAASTGEPLGDSENGRVDKAAPAGNNTAAAATEGAPAEKKPDTAGQSAGQTTLGPGY